MDEEARYIKDFCKTNRIKTLKNCYERWTRFIQMKNHVEQVNRRSHFVDQASIKVPYAAFLLFKKNNKKTWYDVVANDIPYLNIENGIDE